MKNVSKVLTANRLSDGISVWYAEAGAWVEHVGQAYAVTAEDDIAVLEGVAAQTLAKGQYCDVLLIDVEHTASGPRPLKLRERIRADGPTIRFGNQPETPAKAA